MQWSKNPWDWLGHGIYFWEHNPGRALQYAQEVKDKKQFARAKINVPFVLGAVLDLKHCLNLTEANNLNLLKQSFNKLKTLSNKANQDLPKNKGRANRQLDCAVINSIHKTNENEGLEAFDTVRGAFPEGKPVYTSCKIKDRTHIQICVRSYE